MTWDKGQRCPVCGNDSTRGFLTIEQVPVYCNVLLDTALEALAMPRGDLAMRFCENCGHVFNGSFNPSLLEYSQAYENSLHFSGKFDEYARALAERLVHRYDLHGRTVIEIACGKGDFLRLLCRLGDNTGIGFDPSYVPAAAAPEERVTFVQDYYSDRYASGRADLVSCRHALEHVPDPRVMVSTAAEALVAEPPGVTYFEVPNVRYTLMDGGIWDLIYEHYSYFSEQSLAFLFQQAGYCILDLGQSFEGQFLYVEATRGDTRACPEQEPAETRESQVAHVEAFADAYHAKLGEWRATLHGLREAGRTPAVWGAGSKGVMFLNTIAREAGLQTVVDVNPRKHGKFVAGTGQRIVSPRALGDMGVDTVIIMNPAYRDEIASELRGLGFHSETLVA
jgi:SAM-dependent methyltransferase